MFPTQEAKVRARAKEARVVRASLEVKAKAKEARARERVREGRVERF